MKMKHLVLGAALVAGVSSQMPARAQTYPATLPPNVGTGDCDRACLNGIAEQFIAALIAHDPSKAPLAKGVRYSENGVELPIPDGLWKNASGQRPYRLYVDDPEWGTVGFFSRIFENGAPRLLTTRLKIYNHQITEIEAIPAASFGDRPARPGAPPPVDYLNDTPRPQFSQVVAPRDRRSRDDLMKIVNTYFTGIENNVGKLPPLFAKDCHRLENGTPTTNVPMPAGQTIPNGGNMSCIDDFANGAHHNDTRLRNRRILAVDLEHQLVFAGVYFDHDNSPAVRDYTLNNGQKVHVADPEPDTLGMDEIFQIDRDGHISQVEAIMTSVPYGSRPYFDTGFHMDSPQAVQDGFKEYQH